MATVATNGAQKRTIRREAGRGFSRLIQVYSLRGHQIADIDPLGLMDRPTPGVLKLEYLGLSEADMDTEFYTGGLAGSGNKRMRLRDILGAAEEYLLRQDRRRIRTRIARSRTALAAQTLRARCLPQKR